MTRLLRPDKGRLNGAGEARGRKDADVRVWGLWWWFLLISDRPCWGGQIEGGSRAPAGPELCCALGRINLPFLPSQWHFNFSHFVVEPGQDYEVTVQHLPKAIPDGDPNHQSRNFPVPGKRALGHVAGREPRQVTWTAGDTDGSLPAQLGSPWCPQDLCGGWGALWRGGAAPAPPSAPTVTAKDPRSVLGTSVRGDGGVKTRASCPERIRKGPEVSALGRVMTASPRLVPAPIAFSRSPHVPPASTRHLRAVTPSPLPPRAVLPADSAGSLV